MLNYILPGRGSNDAIYLGDFSQPQHRYADTGNMGLLYQLQFFIPYIKLSAFLYACIWVYKHPNLQFESKKFVWQYL